MSPSPRRFPSRQAAAIAAMLTGVRRRLPCPSRPQRSCLGSLLHFLDRPALLDARPVTVVRGVETALEGDVEGRNPA
jgi:hypothetical protein